MGWFDGEGARSNEAPNHHLTGGSPQVEAYGFVWFQPCIVDKGGSDRGMCQALGHGKVIIVTATARW